MLKKIEAIIKEEKLADVKEALRAIGIVGMNVSEVRGHGRQGGIVLTGRSGTYQIDMLPKIQLNIVLSEHNVEKTVETIREAAKTGGEGDGIIFICPVDEVVRIRTGERGHEALTYEGDIDSRLAKYYAPPHRGEHKESSTSTEEATPSIGKGIVARILRKERD
jgi:nitrogen regulatory protein P-II 1